MKGEPNVTRNLQVVQTLMICKKRELASCYYQIELAETDNPREKRVVVITQDVALYEHALSLEGRDIRIDVCWVVGQKPDGKPASILTQLKRTVPLKHKVPA